MNYYNNITKAYDLDLNMQSIANSITTSTSKPIKELEKLRNLKELTSEQLKLLNTYEIERIINSSYITTVIYF